MKIQKLKKLFYNTLYKYYPPEMVSWWKRKESVKAKITEAPEGHYIMMMEGEKYPFPGFPRGYLLYGKLSKLKHEIKNQVFNETWHLLENSATEEEAIQHIKDALDNIFKIGQEMRHYFLPINRLVPPVREIYRAMSKVEEYVRPDKRHKVRLLKEVLCLILQEDDAYRFRVQWLVNYFPKKHYRKAFDLALTMMENAEVIGDMKERIRLLRRILNTALNDKTIGTLFDIFVQEVDWKKVKLTKIDKYYFRAKYFKVDYPIYDY